MKKILPFLLLFACSSKEKNEVISSPESIDTGEKSEWIVYEGIIRMDDEEQLVKLSLEQGATGLESGFILTMESDFRNGRAYRWKDFRGNYSMLYGATNDENIFKLHGKMTGGGRASSKKDKKDPTIDVQEVALYFKSNGVQKLVWVDEDFDPIVDDSKYTLYKRSRLFTAEGYITFETARTDFFEYNTSEKWKVAPIGLYDQVKQTYDSIATEKFEGIYLKAVAYYVESDSTDEDLMVVKRILKMSKSDAYTNKK